MTAQTDASTPPVKSTPAKSTRPRDARGRLLPTGTDEGAKATTSRSKLGQLVGFTTEDPITGAEITGRGFVVEDEDGQVLVAPLPATLGIRIPHDQLTD